MNQFNEMLREAFAGTEPKSPPPDRAALDSAIDALDRRDRALRIMVWSSVTFMTAVAAWSAWSFFVLEDAAVRALILRATLFLWAMLGIWGMKSLLFMSQREFAIHKELKRVQWMLVDRNGPSR